MASEYLKWKYRDVKPDEPPPPLTGWHKFQNWLYYHWIYLAAIAVVVAIVASMVWNILGIGKVKPDYIFAYVGENPLPADTVEALQREIAALGEDVNGDGQVAVELRSYVSGDGSDPQYTMASVVTLAADISQGESVFFLTDDPKTLQLRYQILADADGALPADEDYSWEGRAIPWQDCPVLASLPLGVYSEGTAGQEVTGDSQALMSKMYLGRRGFYEPEKNQEANLRLWSILTEGVADY